MYSVFTATLFTNAKIWEQPKSLSTGEWIKKMWCVCEHAHTHTHVHLDNYSAIRKGMKFSHLEQHERLLCYVKEVRQRLCNISHLWSLKITTN